MRRLVCLLVLLPLVAAACGGGAKTSPTATSSKANDPGRTVIAALLDAGAHDDTKALWNLLSRPSQDRLGPTYGPFALASAPQIFRALKPFEGMTITPFISQSVSQQFGVVAIRSGVRALAFPLRRENGGWKIEAPGPLQFQILAPQPGSNSAVSQIAVEVHSPGVVGDAIIWVDGKLVRPTLAPAKGKATVFANLAQALPAGAHIAVVYAEEGSNASAEAWTFSASG